MGTVAPVRCLDKSSNEALWEETPHVERSEENDWNKSHIPQPPSHASHNAGNHSVLGRATGSLFRLFSMAQKMRCKGTYHKVSRETHLASTARERSTHTLEAKAPQYRPSATNGPAHLSPISHQERDLRTGPSADKLNAFAPSSNAAHEPSALFIDETLQFANAFFSPMQPLEIWGTPIMADDNAELPSTRWIRRHTCIRPGNIVQMPSASDKGAIYLLSYQSEQGRRYEVDPSIENNRSQKLFVTWAGGNSQQPTQHSRA
ncbi:hypothetical protein RHS03_09099, partial [Rhizoctonia solani]